MPFIGLEVLHVGRDAKGFCYCRNIDGEIGVRYDPQRTKNALAEALVDKNQDIIVYFPGRSEILYIFGRRRTQEAFQIYLSAQ